MFDQLSEATIRSILASAGSGRGRLVYSWRRQRRPAWTRRRRRKRWRWWRWRRWRRWRIPWPTRDNLLILWQDITRSGPHGGRPQRHLHLLQLHGSLPEHLPAGKTTHEQQPSAVHEPFRLRDRSMNFSISTSSARPMPSVRSPLPFTITTSDLHAP